MSPKKKRKAPSPVVEAPVAPLAPAPEAPMGLLERWAFGPVAAVRPYLVARVVLFLLAVDVWTTHLGASWRYGKAGFNVAHFPVLNALPVPTATAYVGMLGLVSALAAVAASLARPPRWLLAAVAALYLWGWSCSMHDSYQHHYLLSWVLVGLVALPIRPAVDLFGPPEDAQRSAESAVWFALRLLVRPIGTVVRMIARRVSSPTSGAIPRTHAWQYRLVTVLPAVVYAYTAVSKLEPDWRSGDALRTLTRNGEGIEPFLELLRARGVEGEAVWPLLGAATIAIQILVSLSYWIAPLADDDVDAGAEATRTRRWSFLLGLGAALFFPAAGIAIATEPYVIVLVPAVLGLGAVTLALRQLRRTWSLGGVVQGICLVGLIAAIAFHIGAADMGLEIGLFSYYMIAIGLVVLLPPAVPSFVVALVTEPLRALDGVLERAASPVLAVGAAMVALVLLVLLGQEVRAPGAFEALTLVGGAIAVLGVASLLRPALARPLVELVPGVALVVALSLYSLSTTQERFDYFRFAGGDFRRRGEVDEALSAYRAALELAPEEERERIAARIAELEAL